MPRADVVTLAKLTLQHAAGLSARAGHLTALAAAVLTAAEGDGQQALRCLLEALQERELDLATSSASAGATQAPSC